jgi:4-amino-4-deoxy-L-arabinose transferase-like glycosyltransferase
VFGTAFGTQISWFLPAALLALVAGLALTRSAPRTDRTRAALLLWDGWLVVTMAVFSFMSGTIHPYYAVALAPAIAALVAVGGRVLWRQRDDHLARVTLALLVGALGASLGAGSFTAATAATGHSGSIPVAGPSSVAAGGMGGPAGTARPTQPLPPAGGPGGGASTDTALVDLLNSTSSRWSAAVVGDQSAAGYILSTNTAVMAIGGWSGSDDAPTLAEFQRYVADGDISYFIAGGGPGGGRQGGTTSRPARSAPGCRRTTPRPRSAGRPSTT